MGVSQRCNLRRVLFLRWVGRRTADFLNKSAKIRKTDRVGGGKGIRETAKKRHRKRFDNYSVDACKLASMKVRGSFEYKGKRGA